MEKFKNAALANNVQEQRYTTYKITKIIIETMFAMFATAVQITSCDTSVTFRG